MTTRKPKLQNWIIGDVPESCIPIGNQSADDHATSAANVVRARTAEEAINIHEESQHIHTESEMWSKYMERLKRYTKE